MAETKVTPAKAPIVNTRDRQPMETQFDAAEAIKAKHPDRHFRFVNTQRRELGDMRTKIQGYTPAEGDEAMSLGELKLMSCPKGLHEDRQRRIAEVARAREGKIIEKTKEGLKQLGVRPTED